MFDKLEEECGVFGIFGHSEASNMAYLGLYALQHRGQESCGIVSSDGTRLSSHLGMGLVSDVFKRNSIFDGLPGRSAIGHVRYSTAGGDDIKNCQPIRVNYSHGGIAVSHNGNLVNADQLRSQLEKSGSIFTTSADTETIVHLIARSQEEELVDRTIEALHQIQGAYCLVILTETRMIVVRDPNGFRPLSLGRLEGSVVVASETCAFDLIEAEYLRDVEPGEMIVIDDKGMRSYFPFSDQIQSTPCIFEYIYFARPDSRVYGRNVYSVRKEFGRQLARQMPVDADLVIPVPDSGVAPAMGYAEESGLPFELGLIRNHYVGRTFIEPQQSIRHFGVKLKLNPVREILKDKRVVVVDDSIVRGTTSRKIIKMIRNAGAREVHMRIASPPTSYPCFYGIDTPSRKELISASHTIEEIARYITADTLSYLELDGLHSALKTCGDKREVYCDACFNGKYPIKFPHMDGADQPDDENPINIVR